MRKTKLKSKVASPYIPGWHLNGAVTTRHTAHSSINYWSAVIYFPVYFIRFKLLCPTTSNAATDHVLALVTNASLLLLKPKNLTRF